MSDVEHITPIANLNLKLQCYYQVYVIIVMHIYLLKELYGLQTLRPQPQVKIISLKKVILKNWTPFTGWISKLNNKQIDNAKDTDIVMPKHILIEYSNNYSETSESLRQYYSDEPVVDAANGNILDFNVANDFNNSLKLKIRRNRQQWHKRCWHNSAIKICK